MKESEKGIQTRLIDWERTGFLAQSKCGLLVIVEQNVLDCPKILHVRYGHFEECEILVGRESIQFLALDTLDRKGSGLSIPQLVSELMDIKARGDFYVEVRPKSLNITA
jgi:hypothetical protein